MSHVAAANRYIKAVLSDKIPACQFVKLACQRQLDDLKASKDPAYPYRFDTARAEKICKFIECLPHTKGVWAQRGELITLEAWQSFGYSTIYGWVKKSDGLRRFREVYWEVPRKNGKSVIGSCTGLYMLVADGEFGAEVYSGASTEKQAWEVFRPAKLMAERDEDFRSYYGVQVNAKTLNVPGDMSRFEPIIGKPGDGSSPSCALIDEYHEHDTDDLYSTMITGMGARSQPLAFIITTAGSNIGGPCYAKRSDVIKILEGSYDAPDVFGCVYTLDPGDDWTTSEALQKANPNYGVSVSAEFLLAEQRKAIQSAYLQNNFKTKHLNIWCSSSAAYFNMQGLEGCIDPTLDINDFAGEECIVPLDLASKVDMAGLIAMFRREIDGLYHYYAFPRFYLPDETAYDPKNKQYQAWANGELLTVTSGNIIDYEWIERDLLQWAGQFEVKEVPFDPWNATQIATRMEAEGLTMVEIQQNVRNMSAPMKELDALIRAKRFHFDGNMILKWMFSNVVAKVDANDNVFPRKERNENKIDGVVGVIMGLNRWMAQTDDTAEPRIRFV